MIRGRRRADGGDGQRRGADGEAGDGRRGVHVPRGILRLNAEVVRSIGQLR